MTNYYSCKEEFGEGPTASPAHCFGYFHSPKYKEELWQWIRSWFKMTKKDLSINLVFKWLQCIRKSSSMLSRGNKQHYQTVMTKYMLLDGQNHLDSGRSGFFFLLAHNVLHFPLTDKGMPKHWHSLLWKALSTRFVCQNKTKNPKASSGINLFLKCLYNKVLKDLKEAINICINYYPAFIIYNYSTKNKGRNSREEKSCQTPVPPSWALCPFI